MTQERWRAILLALLSTLLLSGALAQSPVVRHFSLPDTEGRKHSVEEWRQTRAVVLFFISTECPISNRYAPEINRIAASFASQQVVFYAVHSDPALSASEARQHATDFGYKFTVLLDPTQVLASQTGVEATPTAVILSPQGAVLYRGRIDNRYLDFGRYRDTNIKPDLQLALQAVLNGKPIEEPTTKVIGCVLPPPAKEKE